MTYRIFIPLIALLLPACVAKTAIGVATAPVKAGSKAADWATTSQDEADRARGREMRKQEKERRKACKDAGYSDC
tara:strand:+ start:699 stop:923 length:225 start_codon:yes stop_codon:yes gene_type:complete